MKSSLLTVLVALTGLACRQTTEPSQHPYMRASIEGVHWDADSAAVANPANTGDCTVILGYSGTSRADEYVIMFTVNRDSLREGATYSTGLTFGDPAFSRDGHQSDPQSRASVTITHYSASWIEGTFHFRVAPWHSTDTVTVTEGAFGVFNR